MVKLQSQSQLDQSPINSPVSSPDRSGKSARRIPLTEYFTYLDMYESELYVIWPVVHISKLKTQLSAGADIEPEAHAMAAALCAATILQLRLPNEKGDGTSSVSSDTFVRDCLRYRNTLGYSETISTEMLLISLFLHMYYANADQVHAATFALRDAITCSHLLRLDDHIALDSLPDEQRDLRIRIFWVLFVTERLVCDQIPHPQT
jgi:hypothetical protein